MWRSSHSHGSVRPTGCQHHGPGDRAVSSAGQQSAASIEVPRDNVQGDGCDPEHRLSTGRNVLAPPHPFIQEDAAPPRAGSRTHTGAGKQVELSEHSVSCQHAGFLRCSLRTRGQDSSLFRPQDRDLSHVLTPQPSVRLSHPRVLAVSPTKGQNQPQAEVRSP